MLLKPQILKFDQKSSSYTKFHKILWTGRVEILWRIFKKSAKKFKWSHNNGKTLAFDFWVTSVWIFFAIFSNAPEFPVILYFMKFFVAQNSITRFLCLLFRKVKKLNISIIYKSIIITFLVNLPLVLYTIFFLNQLQPPVEPWEHRLGEVLQGRSKSKFKIILFFFFQTF